MTTEGKSHTACKLLTLFINVNNEILSLFWFHIRRIPHHIINFQSLVITFHWSHLTLLCWGTLVLAGCCLCYRLLVLGVPVLAPLAQQWLRLKREERGGLTSLPIQGAGDPTRPGQTRALSTKTSSFQIFIRVWESWQTLLGRLSRVTPLNKWLR